MTAFIATLSNESPNSKTPELPTSKLEIKQKVINFLSIKYIVFKPKSTTQELFGSVSQADLKVDAAKSGKEATSKVNFTIGAPTSTQKFYDETTAANAFSGPSREVERAQVDKPNLRQANFNVGT